MLGLLLVLFIGKHFYDHAFDHDKSPWLYGILGIVAYYAGSFIGGIILALVFEIMGSTPLEERSTWNLTLIALPFGIAACWAFHKILEKRWIKEKMDSEDLIDEIGDE